MYLIPPYVYLIGAFIAWAGLMLTWSKHIHEATEQRRIKAVAKGEAPPEIRGVSNYERAELRETAHRGQFVSKKEKWIGKGLGIGIPIIILTIFLTNAQF